MKTLLKKYKKKLIAVVIVLILVIGAVVLKNNFAKKQRQMMQGINQTQTASVERRNLMSTISATGSIVSSDSKTISISLTNTEVESVSAKVGDIVNVGDVICTFDSSDISSNLSEAQESLNITVTKTQMDIASSERSLAETVESNSINLERATDAVNDSYDAYIEAENAEKTAKQSYEEAKNKADSLNSKIGNYNKYKKQLNTYTTEFDAAKESLLSFISSNTSICKDNAAELVNALSIDNAVTLTSAELIMEGNDTSEAEALISNVISVQSKYNEVLVKLNKLGSLEDLKKQYETAKQSADSLKSAYEKSQSSTDSLYDAYEQKIQNKEDTERNNASSIANKNDNLTTTKLNASTSGDNERKQIEEYKEQLENCTVESPIYGVITELNVETGDVYNGSALATIEDISSYKITTEIDEYDIKCIEVGQKVVIKTNGTGDLELDGTVESVAPRASSNNSSGGMGGSSSSVTYTVIVSVDTPCEDIKLDMTAKLSIILDSKENVLTVPYNAVQEDDEGNYYVEVVDFTSSVSSENGDFEKPEMNGDMPEFDMENMPEFDKDNIPQIGGDFPMPGGGNMPQMGGNSSQRGRKNSTQGESQTVNSFNTKRVYITKGIESDYYIEIITDEITEGMEVVVPQTEETQSIRNMMMMQGPMGGF